MSSKLLSSKELSYECLIEPKQLNRIIKNVRKFSSGVCEEHIERTDKNKPIKVYWMDDKFCMDLVAALTTNRAIVQAYCLLYFYSWSINGLFYTLREERRISQDTKERVSKKEHTLEYFLNKYKDEI